VESEAGTRERILVAALQVFAEHGFDGARTREIADRAGANLGLITYYFDTKERLWQAAVSLAFRDLQAELGDAFTAGAAAPSDERAELERLLRRFVHFLAGRPEFMRLMNDEGKRDGPRMRWLADHFVKPMGEALRARLASAARSGIVPPISPVILHYLVLGAAGLAFSQAPECSYVTGVDPTSEAFATAHADALVQFLLRPAPASIAAVKHAGPAALSALEATLAKLRRHGSLKERTRGSFYHRGSGFLHFHEDPAGLFADLKIDGEFERFRVSTSRERAALLRTVAKLLAPGVEVQ
jgi:AcrR family transcriptional regulator